MQTEAAELDETIKQKRKDADEMRKKLVAAQVGPTTAAVRVHMGGRRPTTRKQCSAGSKQTRTGYRRCVRLEVAASGHTGQTLSKYTLQLTQNAKLREVIDHLKQERESFDGVCAVWSDCSRRAAGIYKKLERELTDIKKQMADVIEKSNQVPSPPPNVRSSQHCAGVRGAQRGPGQDLGAEREE